MLRCILVLVSLLCSLPVAVAADAARKYALVIGIDNYQNVKKLRRARSDATAVAKAFRDIGFDEVLYKEDLTRSDFNEVWVDLLGKVKPGDSFAFYFAGHGVELSGQNFLIPKDVPKVQVGRDDLLRRESLSLQEFLTDLRGRKLSFSLIILDACRENPFEKVATRTVGSEAGLANPEPPRGTFMMYSAAQGQTALDRLNESDADPNSVYTRSLLRIIAKPGAPLSQIAKELRAEVKDLASTVNHDQTPAYYDSLIGDACLFGKTCGGSTETLPSVSEGVRLAEHKNYSMAINRHLKPLAESGNREAAVALWKIYDKLKNSGEMLDWLTRAADLGDDPSAINVAWANAQKGQLERLPKDWYARLRTDTAKVLARAAVKRGDDEGAMILYALDEDERNSEPTDEEQPEAGKRELPGDVAVREAAIRGYPAAMVVVARAMVPDVGQDDALTKEQKASTVEAMKLFAGAARKGNLSALYEVLNDQVVDKDLMRREGLQYDLTDDEIAKLLSAVRTQVAESGTFEAIKSRWDILPEIYQSHDLSIHWVERLLDGRGFQRSPETAMKVFDEVVLPLAETSSNSGEGDGSVEIFTLKGRILEALGETDEALRYYLGTAEEYQQWGRSHDLKRAVSLLDRVGWIPEREKEVAALYPEHCYYPGLTADAVEDESGAACYEMTKSLILGRRRGTFGAIAKEMKEYFNPEYGSPPDQDEHMAIVLYFKAKLADQDSSFLAAGDTIEKLMAKAATLGSKDAQEWFVQSGRKPPKSNGKVEATQIGEEVGNWAAGQKTVDKEQVACYMTTSNEGVATQLRDAKRKPRLGLLAQKAEQWGVGTVFYDADLDDVSAGTVRVYLDAVEFKTSPTVTNRRIKFTGDQNTFIQRLIKADDIRIEFKAGQHQIRDTHSLNGFRDTYKTMIDGCKQAESVP